MLTQQVLGVLHLEKWTRPFSLWAFFRIRGWTCRLGAPLGSEVSVHKGTMTLRGRLQKPVSEAAVIKYKQPHQCSSSEGGHLKTEGRRRGPAERCLAPVSCLPRANVQEMVYSWQQWLLQLPPKGLAASQTDRLRKGTGDVEERARRW